MVDNYKTDNLRPNMVLLRKYKGWTQQNMADKLKITRAKLGSIEERRVWPERDIVQTFAEIFRIPFEAMYEKPINPAKLPVAKYEAAAWLQDQVEKLIAAKVVPNFTAIAKELSISASTMSKYMKKDKPLQPGKKFIDKFKSRYSSHIVPEDIKELLAQQSKRIRELEELVKAKDEIIAAMRRKEGSKLRKAS